MSKIKIIGCVQFLQCQSWLLLLVSDTSTMVLRDLVESCYSKLRTMACNPIKLITSVLMYSCWLSVDHGTIFGFVGPMILIILVSQNRSSLQSLGEVRGQTMPGVCLEPPPPIYQLHQYKTVVVIESFSSHFH